MLLHESAAINLQSQVVAVQNIQMLVPTVLGLAASNYTRWRGELLVLGKYSLQEHVLANVSDRSFPDCTHGFCCPVLNLQHHLR